MFGGLVKGITKGVGGLLGGGAKAATGKANLPEFSINQDNYDFNQGGFADRFGQAFNQSTPDSGAQYRGELFDTLASRVRGEAPSVAEQQFSRSLEQGVAAQQAQAAAGGFNPAAQRAASYNIGGLTQGSARDAATLRAQEQQSAEQLFAQALSQQRGQDIQQQQVENQYRLGYEQMGFNRDQAASLAKQELERLRLQEFGIRADASAGNAQRKQKAVGGVLEGVASAAPAILGLFSDVNLKKDIKDGNDSAKAFLDALKAYDFKYKDGNGEQQLGVMAQDLEKSPMTAGSVIDTEDGKMVDFMKNLPAMMAGMSNLNERVKQLEG
jgi:hypothetical protein